MSVTITADEPEQLTEESAVIDAERAAGAAQAAETAAGMAMVAADVVAAQAADNAATTIAQYEGRLSECQAQLAVVSQGQDALSNEVTALRAEVAMLTERLTPSEPQAEESPPNPAPDPEGEADGNGDRESEATTASEQAEAVTQEPAKEPERPERKRAHRWI